MSDAYKADPRFESFIQGLREGKTVDLSRRESSLNWNGLYKMRKRDEAFRVAWDQALIEGGRRYPPDCDPRYDIFIKCLSEGKTVGQSLSISGLYWRRIYLRKNSDPEFQQAWDAAMIAGGKRVGDSGDPRFEGFLLALADKKTLNDALAEADLDCRTLYAYKTRNRKFQDEFDRIVKEGGVQARFGDPRYDIFLDGLRDGKTVNEAMRDSALNWKNLYTFKNGDSDFREAWEDAVAVGGRVFSRFKAMTDEVVESFLAGIRRGDTVKNSAHNAGVTLASIYKRSTLDPELAAAWQEAYRIGKTQNARLQDETLIFLSKIVEGYNVSDAAKIAGKDITTFYRLKKKDGDFAAKWEEATEAKRLNTLQQKLASRKAAAQAKEAGEPTDLSAAPKETVPLDIAPSEGIGKGLLEQAGLMPGPDSTAASLKPREKDEEEEQPVLGSVEESSEEDCDPEEEESPDTPPRDRPR
jgi:hypothetical protein